MKLIVGLGNPGKEYENTRHNVGFWVVQDLAKKYHCSLSSKKKFEALMGETEIEGEKVFMALPQTYMNLSGRSVCALMNYFKLSSSDLVVVHDELDLPVGKIKVVRQAGAAGHRGVDSIQECLGSKTFCRFRIGIGRPEQKQETVDFVLDSFGFEEKKQLDPILKKAREGLEIWVGQDVEAAIQFCHRS
jgi:PTH1 family peptidyl-tRNA hydrolase